MEAACSQPVEMKRFRPNVVVSGEELEAFEEDFWHRFSISSSDEDAALQLESVKPCSRCKVTNVNQDTGAVSPNTLQTLMQMRRGRQLASKVQMFADRPEWEQAAFFTWNCVAHDEGFIAVGDTFTVNARRE